MNHIAKLTADRDALRGMRGEARAELRELLAYLQSPKFCGTDGDYVHISTDLWPRLLRLRSIIEG